MERTHNRISLNYTDPHITSLIKSVDSTGPDDGSAAYTRHYTQNEEFFLKLDREFEVPSFPIHHDVRQPKPSDQYLESLKSALHAVVPLVPDLFRGLTYFFDPSDTLRPGFYQLYRLADTHYLYMLKIDLSYKAGEHEVVTRGTNDTTASYRSSKVFIDAIVVPLEQVRTENGRVAGFDVLQKVSQTWIGETGRGYFVQGIWIDHELTKFFSKLFLPENKRTYPYYPFQCRYRTVCATDISTSSEGRKRAPVLLHRALGFVSPYMEHIQESLRDGDFSTDLEAFRKIKSKLPDYWAGIWNGISVKAYLNDRDMKEFAIET